MYKKIFDERNFEVSVDSQHKYTTIRKFNDRNYSFFISDNKLYIEEELE